MIDKKEYICSMPFQYTEVYDDKQYLCCPSWLPVDVWDGDTIKSSFNSDKAKEVRESILDGSFNGEIEYKQGRGPVDIKIFNPLDVQPQKRL